MGEMVTAGDTGRWPGRAVVDTTAAIVPAWRTRRRGHSSVEICTNAWLTPGLERLVNEHAESGR